MSDICCLPAALKAGTAEGESRSLCHGLHPPTYVQKFFVSLQSIRGAAVGTSVCFAYRLILCSGGLDRIRLQTRGLTLLSYWPLQDVWAPAKR